MFIWSIKYFHSTEMRVVALIPSHMFPRLGESVNKSEAVSFDTVSVTELESVNGAGKTPVWLAENETTPSIDVTFTNNFNK